MKKGPPPLRLRPNYPVLPAVPHATCAPVRTNTTIPHFSRVFGLVGSLRIFVLMYGSLCTCGACLNAHAEMLFF